MHKITREAILAIKDIARHTLRTVDYTQTDEVVDKVYDQTSKLITIYHNIAFSVTDETN